MPRGPHWPLGPNETLGRGAMQSTAFDGAVAVDQGGSSRSLTVVETARVGPRPPPPQWASLSMDCAARTSYQVVFSNALLQSQTSALVEAIGDRKALLVTTPTVDRMYGSAIRAVLEKTDTVSTLVLNVREETKSMELVQSVCAEAFSHGLNRRGLLIRSEGASAPTSSPLPHRLCGAGFPSSRCPPRAAGRTAAGSGPKDAGHSERNRGTTAAS